MRKYLLPVYAVAFFTFLLAPVLALTIGSLTEANYVSFPPEGLSLRWYMKIFAEQESMYALIMSLGVATAAATVATAMALPTALALHRYRTPLNKVVYLLVMTPAMLPAVFLGLAFLLFYSALGFGGTPLSLVAGHIMIATPFAVSMNMVGLASNDGALERAARSLGASPIMAFRKITVPSISWSLFAGWGFAFMISFGSLEVSLFLSTFFIVTLTLEIYTGLEWSPLDPSLTAVSSGLVIVTLTVLILTARFVKIDRFLQR